MELSHTCKKYSECLNDLMDYFILADVEVLSLFQQQNDLSCDLLSEFTGNDSGDLAISSGAILPLVGIENYPYTVYFNTGNDSIFDKTESDLQYNKTGYILQVVSERVHLFTMPLLRRWPQFITVVNAHKPFIKLDNGWYEVVVNAGETLQESGWEPTIEFLFTHKAIQPDCKADINYRYAITSRAY